ncbi:MAG: S8 family serine peptidase [Peptostreptococcaceae bacterium]|nr:S8 family serine peptidase [Peptostreptococcaceae bacterium]
MKRKILSAVLSATLVLSSFAPYSYADPLNRSDEDLFEMVSLNTEEGSSAVADLKLQKDPVLLDFLRQAGSKYQDDSEIRFIAEINDKTMVEKHALIAPDISQVRSENGLSEQLEYAKRSQDLLIKAIDDLGVKYEVTESYDVALNGLAIRTTFADAKKIVQLPEVFTVEVNRVIPAPPELPGRSGFALRDASSNNMINVPRVGNRFNGKGQLIAVIDSGGDPTHDIFTKPGISPDGRKIQDAATTDRLVQEHDLSRGKYFNDKVPFGYNYADKNQNITETSKRSHGMHVAGIIAANTQKLQGVAPEAQIAVMRAFGANVLFGGTTPEIYNKAIDDSVKLGADSINMSLGATGTTDGRMEQTTINALKRAQAAGIVVAIAIGNDGFMGFGALEGPGASNPDFGLTNSPAVADLSLAVASVDNAEIKQRGIRVTEGPGKEKLLLYMPTDDKPFPDQALLVVNCGHGYEDEFPDKVRGQVALIQRGDGEGEGRKKDFSFAEKIRNAEKKGAAVVIVYNHLDEFGLTHMAGVENVNIPSVFISKEDGEYLKKNPHYTVFFETDEKAHVNPTGYRVSNFSSWGVSPEGNLKPDISAPGGQIDSSVNQNSYDKMSGTSMATPHVAGGIAIAKQYVEKNFPEIQGAEKHRLIKNLLMSTSTPFLDPKTGAHGSPRGQGAGLLNLAGVISSSVVIEGTNHISSINLRNITGDTVTIKGTLRNYANEPKTFSYHAELNTDTVENGKIMLKPRNVERSASQEITVDAKSTKNFTVTFALDAGKMAQFEKEMPNGFFLEGFVFFEPKVASEAKISVPFVGFKGDWETIPVIDPSIYHHLEKGTKPYYYEKTDIVANAFTHISSKESGEEVVLGQDVSSTFEAPKFALDNIAFSPNNDGRADTANFVGTFLRNYKDFEINIYDGADKTKLDPIYNVSRPNDFGMKNYVVLGPFGGPNLVSTKPHWRWDGTNLAGLQMPEGKYVFEVKVKPDGESYTKAQTIQFPITIDTTFPRIAKSSYDQVKGEYKLQVIEEGSGIRTQEILIGKDSYKANEQGVFTLPAGTDPKTAVLKIQDHARNVIQLPLDKSIKTGNERMVIVSPIISSGSVPMDKFKWIVQDSEGHTVDPYDLKVGRYTLLITEVDENFEVDEDRIEFEITEADHSKVVEVNFSYKNKTKVIIMVDKPRNSNMKVVLIDKNTGKEYFAVSESSRTQYVAIVPEGEYKVTAREFDPVKYVAYVVNGENLIVKKTGLQANYPTVQLIEKEPHAVTVNLKRNDYTGKATLVFRGQDVHNTMYKLDLEANENSKQVTLLRNLPFKIYVTNVAGYGIEEQEYKPHGSTNYTVEVELIKGKAQIPVPTDKSDLMILINQVKDFKENDYDPDGWEVFEVALDKAQKLYEDPSATQDDIDAMIKELNEAIKGLSLLKGEGNKALLKAKIDEAKAILESFSDLYEEKSVEFLTLAIQGAELTYMSKDPQYNTEKHINDTINMLDRAIQNLKRKDGKLDTSQLEVLIKESDKVIEQKNLYKENTIKKLETALKEAKEVLQKAQAHNKKTDQDDDDDEITQEEIQSVIIDLRLALAGVESKAEKTALKEEINRSEQIDLSRYELEGKSDFRKALKEAKQIYYNKRSLQDAVNKAAVDLKAKREALTPKQGGGSTEGDKSISFKNTGLNAFLQGKAKVKQIGNGAYEYKIMTKMVTLPLNGQDFEAKVSAIKVNGQVIKATVVNGMNEFTFTLPSQVTEQSVELTIDLFEELGAKPLVETFVFR